jgi:hypothetical protein
MALLMAVTLVIISRRDENAISPYIIFWLIESIHKSFLVYSLESDRAYRVRTLGSVTLALASENTSYHRDK